MNRVTIYAKDILQGSEKWTLYLFEAGKVWLPNDDRIVEHYHFGADSLHVEMPLDMAIDKGLCS